MSKDISTQYTKMRNRQEGRKGYYAFKSEKVTVISPKNYGIFLKKQKRSKNGNRN